MFDTGVLLAERDLLIKKLDATEAALAPFAAMEARMKKMFEPRPDENKFIQIAGAWLTWGHFRRAAEAYGFSRDGRLTQV